MQHPLAVAPPETTSCIVMVLWLVREAVVVPVKTHPFNWAALAGQGAHDHEDTLEPYGHHKAAVRHQPVQAEGHSQNGDPVQNSEGDHRTPAPELGQKGHSRKDVVNQHEAGGTPLNLSLSSGKWSARALNRLSHPQYGAVTNCLRGNQKENSLD